MTCQDLSVAGRRAGLAGERSGLFFEFARIVEEMRHATNGQYPAFALIENVPGLLSSNGGRDFGVLLARLAELGALDIAWGVLDSRFFGVAQRRRRVFIVADFRGERAAEILSIAESLCGHPAPGGEEGEDIAGTLGGRAAGEGGFRNDLDNNGAYPPVGGSGPSSVGEQFTEIRPANWKPSDGTILPAHEAKNPHTMQAFGGNNTSGPIDAATACNAHGGPHGRLDFESETFVVAVAGTLAANTGPNGHDAGNFCSNQAVDAGHIVAVNAEHGLAPHGSMAYANQGHFGGMSETDTSDPLRAKGGDTGNGGESLVLTPAFAFKPSHYTRGKDGAPSEVTPPLSADADKGDQDPVVLAPIGFASNLGTQGGDVYEDVSPTVRVGSGANIPSPPAVLAFNCKQSAGESGEDIAPTLQAMPHDASHANGGGQVAVAFNYNLGSHDSGVDEDGLAPVLRKNSHPAVAFNWQSGGDCRLDPSAERTGALHSSQTPAVAFSVSENSNGHAWMSEAAPTLQATPPSGGMHQQYGVIHAAIPRRLTPRECELLQSFPVDWTRYGLAYPTIRVPNPAYTGDPPAVNPTDEALAEDDEHGSDEEPKWLIVEDTTGELREVELADGPRYRMMGNAVTVNVIAWIARRILAAHGAA